MSPRDELSPPVAAKPTGRETTTILLTIADTTWRMVLPSVFTVAAGLVADLHRNTAPWLTLLGLALGLTGSGLLIRRQMRGLL